MTEIRVRYGKPADVHNFMDLCRGCALENGLANMDEHKVLGEVWSSLHNTGGVIGVIGLEGEPLEAGIMLRIDGLPYSYEQVICERAIYVRPEFRAAKGGRARLLGEFAKHVSETLELPLLISILSTHRAAGKVRLYERLFGPPAGAYWLWGAKTGQQQEAAE